MGWLWTCALAAAEKQLRSVRFRGPTASWREDKFNLCASSGHEKTERTGWIWWIHELMDGWIDRLTHLNCGNIYMCVCVIVFAVLASESHTCDGGWKRLTYRVDRVVFYSWWEAVVLHEQTGAVSWSEDELRRLTRQASVSTTESAWIPLMSEAFGWMWARWGEQSSSQKIGFSHCKSRALWAEPTSQTASLVWDSCCLQQPKHEMISVIRASLLW